MKNRNQIELIAEEKYECNFEHTVKFHYLFSLLRVVIKYSISIQHTKNKLFTLFKICK